MVKPSFLARFINLLFFRLDFLVLEIRNDSGFKNWKVRLIALLPMTKYNTNRKRHTYTIPFEYNPKEINAAKAMIPSNRIACAIL
jgi:hypothetical protein